MYFSLFILILLGCSAQFTQSYNQILKISEGSPSNNPLYNSVTFTKSNSQVNCSLSTTKGYNLRGMWQIHDGVSGLTALASFYTTSNSTSGEYNFNTDYTHITALRPLCSLELTDVALSLYEKSIYDYPFGIEHHFTERAWSGEPFPVGAFALTGWSNWTLYEEPNFSGKSYCLRATLLYQYANTTSSFPAFVGSLLRDCDSRKIDVEINLPFYSENEEALNYELLF